MTCVWDITKYVRESMLIYLPTGRRELKQIQEILSKIGTEFFKIDEEMTEKNESEDGNSISLKSP